MRKLKLSEVEALATLGAEFVWPDPEDPDRVLVNFVGECRDIDVPEFVKRQVEADGESKALGQSIIP